jgi:hypothetical protein
MAEQLERIEVLRLARQNLPAQRFGLRQLPTMNQREGLLNLSHGRVRSRHGVAHRTARSCIRRKAASK